MTDTRETEADITIVRPLPQSLLLGMAPASSLVRCHAPRKCRGHSPYTSASTSCRASLSCLDCFPSLMCRTSAVPRPAQQGVSHVSYEQKRDAKCTSNRKPRLICPPESLYGFCRCNVNF
eukprot:5913918-Amphidinium_carterae.1